MGKEKIIQGLKKNTMVIVLIIVFLFFTVRTGGSMILPQNINNLIAQNSYVFILATGMLLCILTGGNIDLSVGSVVAFVGAIGGALMVNMKFSTPLTLVVMIVVGILIGIWQGFWIAYVRIPPFIVTLAGMLMFRGVANIVLQGRTLAPLPNDFMGIFNGYVPDLFGGQGFNITCMLIGVLAVVLYFMLTLKNRKDKIKKGYEVVDFKAVLFRLVLISVVILWFTNRLAMYKGIPNVLIWVAVVILLYAYITSKTTTGRYFYAVGGNEKAAALSGINTNRVYFLAYMNMGFLAAIAAMVTIARLNSANPTAGGNYEMDAISSCFIGGASAYGGTGTVPGVIIGATLMGVINLGMYIMGVDANYQKLVKGLVLLASVAFDVVSKKKQS
ncbi:MAG: multiple monosaccharide ABC transporter permease [Lachnospiraceae bacterium]|nr:multiple monosaccharide ABC transporter permease [Lachnospiraceae bacterium]